MEGIQKLVACMLLANLPTEALPEILEDLQLAHDYYKDHESESSQVTSATPLPIANLTHGTATLKIPY